MEDVCFDQKFEHMVGWTKYARMEVFLSQVCRRWREVAISTPVLWTEIEGPESQRRKGTTRTEAYLSRSKNRLVDVTLSVTLDYIGQPRANWGQDFLQVAAKHSTRWRSFTLQFPKEYTDRGGKMKAKDLCDILEEVAVPQLQTADISIDYDSAAWDPFEHQIFLQGTPRLSTLHLNTVSYFWFLFPMDAVTTLTIHCHDASIPIKQILGLPSLQHLNIKRHKGPVYTPIEFREDVNSEDDDDGDAGDDGDGDSDDEQEEENDEQEDEDDEDDDAEEDEEDEESSNVLKLNLPSKLVSLRISICDLAAFCEIPETLHPALADVKNLFLFEQPTSEDDDYSSDEEDDEWNEWPSTLAGLQPQHLGIFPSLEHLSVKLSPRRPPSTLKNYPSLCRLTSNIRTLTIISGCLQLDEEYGNLQTMWPRLEKVHFETLPDGLEERNRLLVWITERGRRYSGRFTMALYSREAAKLEGEEDLQKNVESMKQAVRLEMTSPLYFDMWPPRKSS